MLRALLVLHLTALAIGNPFHKYPFVFLLDVGNEELENVSTEQIRISKQGGSLALRYPAIGYGPDIAHVRVSGIDFGTDLKAEIVEGGPGYKYVVLVLMGNQGVDFDAVVTIQTVPPNSDNNLQSIDSDSNNSNNRALEDENDPNDSSEDISDNDTSEEASQSAAGENAELTQESSNVYNSYIVNEALSGYGNSIHSNQNQYTSNDETNDNDDEDDTDLSDQNIVHIQNSKDENLNDFQDDDQTDAEYSQSVNQNAHDHSNGKYPDVNEQSYASDDDNQEQISPSLYGNEVVISNPYKRLVSYPQTAMNDESDTIYIEEPNEDSSINLEEIFSDEYDADDGDVRQYSDKNNNFIDRNDRNSIAY